MKLSTKIILGFGVVSLIFAGLALFVILALRPVQKGSDELSTDVLPTLNDSSTIQYDVAIDAELDQGLRTPADRQYVDQLKQLAGVFNNAVVTVKAAELLSDVAAASQEQSRGIHQISRAITEIDKVTQSNAASSEESASAASSLSEQAGNLLEAVRELTVVSHGQNGHQPGSNSNGRIKALSYNGMGD